MRTHRTRRPRWTVAGLALGAALTLGACSDENDTGDEVTDPVTDQASTTPPEEGDQGGEEDTGGEMDDN